MTGFRREQMRTDQFSTQAAFIRDSELLGWMGSHLTGKFWRPPLKPEETQAVLCGAKFLDLPAGIVPVEYSLAIGGWEQTMSNANDQLDDSQCLDSQSSTHQHQLNQR